MLRKQVPIVLMVLSLAGSSAPAADADEDALRAHLDHAEDREIDRLGRALGAEEKILRMRAVQDLGGKAAVGQRAPRAVALLRTAVADEDADVAYQARVELARLEGVDLIPAAVREEHRLALARAEMEQLEESLGSPDALTRLGAVQRLASIREGSAGEARVRTLLDTARRDADPGIAYQASVELALLDGVDLIGPDIRAAHRLSLERREVDELEAELGSEAMIVRLGAVQRLADLIRGAVEPARLLSLLSAAAGDPDPDVAEQARLALAKWDGHRAD